MAKFLLYEVPAGRPLTGDLTLELDLEIEEWPEDWAYLVAKHSSQQLHELLIRLKGSEHGRFGFGDGTDNFNAIKFSLKDVVEPGQRFTLKAIRSLHGESTLWVDGQLIAQGTFSPYHTPARTSVLLSVGGDHFGGHTLQAMFHQLQIWQGAESDVLLARRGDREVQLRQIFPDVAPYSENTSD